jgi:RimJ/RimL family protein N-acetyltransferase
VVCVVVGASREQFINNATQMSFEPERLNARLAGACSERLMLRAPRLGDAIDLFEASRNPHFNAHLMWATPPDLSAVSERLQRVIDRADAGICAAFSAIDRASGRWAALFRFEPRPETVWAELGLWSHPDFWGAGHGEEVTRLAIEQAFTKTDLEGVVACAQPAHRVSMRLLERCGLEPLGLEPRAHESGHHVPLMRMLMTRTRWSWLRTESISGWMPEPFSLDLPSVEPALRLAPQ